MTVERTPLSEAELVQALVLDIDDRLASDGHPRVAGGRVGGCGNAADSLSRQGLELGLYIPKISVTAAHRLFGGPVWEVGRYRSGAFGHYFNISDTGLLIDLTFCQFIDPETGKIRQHAGFFSGDLRESPVAQALLVGGSVPLTDGNLRDYLRVTTATVDKSYIESATVEALVPGKII